ncbi:MAG: type I restriction endonuclease [Desulfobacterales bacterium]|nr:type I restriction endonuclease [Desulfobacterales bacterium]MDD3081445.1 type I restriction endonuclease [Desulfobacterales bacterium]MDD3950360.1 type I restriction endonuclease [Desulfobacterales bacterium]MDD4463229.1 type I restriction endonuclease [Desulfobacterales bacterium]MDY0377747.1 type I restriction endonuclease [Desulfobacterales bacterium]
MCALQSEEIRSNDEALHRRLPRSADHRTPRTKIEELNPELPATAYDDAVRQIVAVSASRAMAATNREKYELIKDGVPVTFRNAKGERVKERLRVLDFDNPQNNEFLCVRELWVRGDLYRSK